MRIGIVSDAHNPTTNNGDARTRASNVVRDFKIEGVSLIIGLGDMWDNFLNLAHAQVAIPEYEAIFLASGIPTIFVTGNHDKQVIGLDGYLGLSQLTPAKNFTYDYNDLRFVCFNNVMIENAAQPFIADAETLAWLTAELAKCQTGGIDASKRVVICTHCYIYQDYPGDPEWYIQSPYSVFSYNAGAQRAIVESAKAAGANILAVLHWHAHSSRSSVVNGIQYYGFRGIDNSESFAILEIGTDNIVRVIGNKQQFYYNNSPNYFVSPDGSDDNFGLLKSYPWKTLGKAITGGFADGANTLIMPGIYRESPYMSLNGIADARITWDFEPGAKITGAETITGFALVGSEYQVSLATEAKIVVKDGVMLKEGTAGSLTSGQWDWVSGVLYLKDDPKGHIVEAGQRNSGIGIGSSSQYLTINGLVIYGCNNNPIEVSGTPISVEINDPVLELNRFGYSDASTAAAGNVVVNNPVLRNNKSSGMIFSNTAAPTIRNVLAHGNTTGISVTGSAAPKITGGVIRDNGTGISLTATAGAGTTISNVITYGNTVKGINSSGAGVSEIKNSCIHDAATWGNTVSTNNITSDPKLMPDGRLASDSPCINAGAWVSGPGGNMSGETDRHGHKIHGVPNIGIDQKAGSPGRGRKNLMGSSFSM